MYPTRHISTLGDHHSVSRFCISRVVYHFHKTEGIPLLDCNPSVYSKSNIIFGEKCSTFPIAQERHLWELAVAIGSQCLMGSGPQTQGCLDSNFKSSCTPHCPVSVCNWSRALNRSCSLVTEPRPRDEAVGHLPSRASQMTSVCPVRGASRALEPRGGTIFFVLTQILSGRDL